MLVSSFNQRKKSHVRSFLFPYICPYGDKSYALYIITNIPCYGGISATTTSCIFRLSHCRPTFTQGDLGAYIPTPICKCFWAKRVIKSTHSREFFTLLREPRLWVNSLRRKKNFLHLLLSNWEIRFFLVNSFDYSSCIY